MKNEKLKDFVLEQLEEIKAKDITLIELPEDNSVTDYMIVASGTSSRHVKSIAISLIKSLKENNQPPIGVEGEDVAEWILVDCGDVIAHIMQPTTRDYYQLEKLWQQ